MSFSRIKYDNDAYDLRIDRAVGPGDYRLFKGFNESCKKCLSYDGPRNAKSDVALASGEACDNQWSALTAVESHLTNRVHQLKDSNTYGANDEYKNMPVITVNNCDEALVAEDTRFTYPIEAFRGMDLTSHHYTPFLYTNPQCVIQDNNSKIGLNSRLRVKDTFKAHETIPLDQSSVLPTNNDIDLSQIFSNNMCKTNKY